MLRRGRIKGRPQKNVRLEKSKFQRERAAYRTKKNPVSRRLDSQSLGFGKRRTALREASDWPSKSDGRQKPPAIRRLLSFRILIAAKVGIGYYPGRLKRH